MRIPKLQQLSRPVRYGLTALILLASGVAIKLAFFSTPKAPAYATAIATTGDLEQSVLATGTLQAFKQVSIGAQVSGQVRTLTVALGDTVKKGQLIAEIDSLKQENELRNQQAALQSAQAQLLSRQASLKQADLTFRRQQELLAADAISRESFEQADATLNTSRADIATSNAAISQAKIAVNTAQVNLGYTRILAPMDGVVVAIVAQQGQTVNANQSTPTIIKMALLDTITVKAQISEADVVRVKAGQKVYFTILGAPEKRYYTTLRTIEPAPDSIATDTTTTPTSTATAIYYNGLLDVPNPEGRLRISMTAQVYIVLGDASSAITIPSSALGERDPQGLVTLRVLDAEGKAVPRKVKVGINNNARVQIIEGLAAGEKVVVGDATSAAAGDQPTPQRRPTMRM